MMRLWRRQGSDSSLSRGPTVSLHPGGRELGHRSSLHCVASQEYSSLPYTPSHNPSHTPYYSPSHNPSQSPYYKTSPNPQPTPHPHPASQRVTLYRPNSGNNNNTNYCSLPYSPGVLKCSLITSELHLATIISWLLLEI